jgi:hypothetical protein
MEAVAVVVEEEVVTALAHLDQRVKMATMASKEHRVKTELQVCLVKMQSPFLLSNHA